MGYTTSAVSTEVMHPHQFYNYLTVRVWAFMLCLFPYKMVIMDIALLVDIRYMENSKHSSGCSRNQNHGCVLRVALGTDDAYRKYSGRVSKILYCPSSKSFYVRIGQLAASKQE